jgi:hypothetical protein
VSSRLQPTASDGPADGSPNGLRELLDALPPEFATPVFMHSSWTSKRSESYERLAFLGDSVLGLAVTTHLFPRLDADRYGPGRLTKVGCGRRRRCPRPLASGRWCPPSECWPR